MTAESAAQRNLKESQILARKIDLLLDVMVTAEGRPYEFQDIQSALAEQGVKLSRTRWHHIKTGDTTVRQPREVIAALAEFFDVNPAYLLHADGPVPERIQHELELLAAMRRAKVKEFATRTLAEVDNKTLDAIAALLDDSAKY
ncbi:helix-turn-helix domain-containing protein [Arthrobacter zhangbolii]|uniref:Helix-turn-helix domain-containing protein n=1 Tax=Arthrobacter zhangbolii TaxID=2886936 RepID=A0A9X1M6P4_9MICC|nr:helix-turn-helix domain-containing protein [Arthrobacter zhangbolii]MCC3272226.1 helix-turn-helix domain-containing protein [Arthrobacter zhangbolii]UON91904.1 helix-turn-helix domain-containing protein [Arthrobacter zhangbolii]